MRNALTVACSVVWLLATPTPAMAQDGNGGAPQAPAKSGVPPTAQQAPPLSTAAPQSVEQSEARCRAAWKAYLNSLACFAPYRHSAHVLDIEAFKHCKVVKEPDCPRPSQP